MANTSSLGYSAGSPYSTSTAYDNIFDQIMAAGGPWTFNNTKTVLDQYGTDFAQQFQNAVGRPPTADEINQFYQQAVMPVGSTQAGFSSTDPTAVAQKYIPQAFQSQIQENQAAQIPKLEQQIGDLSANVGKQTAAQLSDPSSDTYRMFSGVLNNMGITPSSGAFQSGLGSTIGNAATQTMQQLLGNLGGGAIAGNQSPSFSSLYGTGQQAGQGMNAYNQSLNDFNIQAALAKQLADESQPSTAMKDIAMAQGASKALMGLGTAAGPAATATSYVCKALIAHGLATESDLDLLHFKTIPAVFQKARAFWWYATHAKELVAIAERDGLDWRMWRKWFLDDPISKSDPVEAVEEYITAYESLCRHLDAMHLWDERVRRTSLIDSLPFLPKVLTYPPFIKAAAKVFCMKHMFVLDLPLSRMPWR